MGNVPGIDTATLKQFLELANVGGTFGYISHSQIIKNMRQVLNYVPGACINSLLILLNLLEVELRSEATLYPSSTDQRLLDMSDGEAVSFFVGLSNSVLSGKR